MRYRLLLLFLASCLIGCTSVTEKNDAFELYLVRHAEKELDAGRDPELTREGHHRAETIAAWLLDKNIKDVWSSDYKRTRSTAEPLANRSNLDLQIYDPRKLNMLAERLIENHHNAFVVGHSNTTPDLARLLCNCEIEDMDESEYDRIIVISVLDGKTRVETIRQTALTAH